jgi:hypothetical protein
MNRDDYFTVTIENSPVSFSDKPFEIKMGTLERKRHNRESAKRKRAMRGNIEIEIKSNIDKEKWNAARMLHDYWSKR